MNTTLQNKDIETLINDAKAKNKVAQHRLFQLYSPKMLSICRYYINDLQYAEDVMISGFYKVFTYLHSYRNEGSFEGWMRKIMTREAISFIRKNKGFLFVDKDDFPDVIDKDSFEEIFEKYDFNEIQKLIDQLPQGYKTVFLLYVLEDYSHKEIATMLKISESTSKTQLFKAKNMLRKNLETLKINKNDTKES